MFKLYTNPFINKLTNKILLRKMSELPMLKRKPSLSKEKYEKDRSEILRQAYKLCREYLQGPWAKVSIDNIEVTPLGGGLTNKLYICKLPEKIAAKNKSKSPNVVLFREYGLIITDFKAQIQESVVFSILAERGVGPKLHAVFPGGRLEEYLPARTLITSDLQQSDLSESIAKCMAEYHMLEMPVKKEPTYISSKMFAYLETAKKSNFDDLKQHQLYKQILDYDLDELSQFVTKMVTKNESVVVFCHNDVQEGNLLLTKRSDRNNPVQMIDFEYSAYNYRGFDLGNHFCEWMLDYSHQEWPFYKYTHKNFPTLHQQIHFVNSYLESIYQRDDTLKSDPRWQRDVLLDEIKRFAMMSHFFWAMWSVVQAKMSTIQFGYLEYAISRLEAMKKQREQFDL